MIYYYVIQNNSKYTPEYILTAPFVKDIKNKKWLFYWVC